MKYIKILSNSWHVANQGASSHKVVWQLVVSNEATDATVALNSPQRRLEQINTAIAHKVHVYISLCTGFSVKTGTRGDSQSLSIWTCPIPRHKLYYSISVQKDGLFSDTNFLNFFYNLVQPHLSSIQVIQGRQDLHLTRGTRTCMGASSVMASPNGFTRLLHAASREQQASIHLECENEY